jgi:hypothetical protein
MSETTTLFMLAPEIQREASKILARRQSKILYGSDIVDIAQAFARAQRLQQNKGVRMMRGLYKATIIIWAEPDEVDGLQTDPFKDQSFEYVAREAGSDSGAHVARFDYTYVPDPEDDPDWDNDTAWFRSGSEEGV